MSVRTKKILLFTGLTFFIDWSIVALYLVLGGKTDSAGMALLAVFYMFVPMLVAIWVQKRILKQPLAGPLGISFKVNRWFFVAWFLPPVIAFVTVGITGLAGFIAFVIINLSLFIFDRFITGERVGAILSSLPD
jgi:hypothetical protein